MRINTDIIQYASAIRPLAKYGIHLNIIKSDNSPYKLAHTNRPNVVISHTASLINMEFPYIKFVGPKCKFPNYDYIPEQGFDKELCDLIEPSKINSKTVFINREGNKNKLFIKKMESLGLAPKVIGSGFGIAQINLQYHIEPASLYKSAQFCGASLVEEIYKILYLGKPCITPWDFPYCNNIMKSNKIEMSSEQIDFAKQFDWLNIFARIFNLIDEEVPWK